jgi:hypothetical protein
MSEPKVLYEKDIVETAEIVKAVTLGQLKNDGVITEEQFYHYDEEHAIVIIEANIYQKIAKFLGLKPNAVLFKIVKIGDKCERNDGDDCE